MHLAPEEPAQSTGSSEPCQQKQEGATFQKTAAAKEKPGLRARREEREKSGRQEGSSQRAQGRERRGGSEKMPEEGCQTGEKAQEETPRPLRVLQHLCRERSRAGSGF